MSTLHIFIHVSSPWEDVFAGVHKSLEHSTQQQDTCVTITLEDHDYEYIENIEFTFRKYARFLYYGGIFRKIEKSVVDVLEKYSDQKSVTFYLAEEGVRIVQDDALFLERVSLGLWFAVLPLFWQEWLT